MKVLIKNKVILFIIYIFVNLVVSEVLLTIRSFQTAGIVLLLFSAITGTIFFLSELNYALKIGVYFLTFLASVLFGYGVFYLLNSNFHINIQMSFGLGLAGVLILFSTSLVFRLQERILEALFGFIKNKKSIEDKGVNFKAYQKSCINEWFQSQSNWIANQAMPMTLVRISGLIICISIGVFGLLGKGMIIFQNDIIFDKLLYFYFIVFGFTYFIAGFRFSAVPAFIAWTLIFISYFVHLLFHPFVINILQHDLITYMIIALAFSIFVVPTVFYLKHELFYSNVQMYERGDKCITVDLFISDFLPIIDLDRLLSFNILLIDYPRIPKDFIQLLKYYVKIMRKHRSLLAGYTTDSHANLVTFYIYTNNFADGLERELSDKTESAGFKIEDIQFKSDPLWNEYKLHLNPNNIELCSITSRSYIEQLFMKGISFDREYEIDFFVNFREKTDPVDFEKELKYFGFSLTYASYDEDNDCLDPEYKYYGEYKTKSFISHRRIEYLNSLLLNKSEEFGSLYVGEWQIDC